MTISHRQALINLPKSYDEAIFVRIFRIFCPSIIIQHEHLDLGNSTTYTKHTRPHSVWRFATSLINKTHIIRLKALYTSRIPQQPNKKTTLYNNFTPTVYVSVTWRRSINIKPISDVLTSTISIPIRIRMRH